jgi:glutaredoxin 3
MFTVYTKPACPFCDQAKALLTAKGELFETINLDVGQPKVDGQQYISRDDLLAKLPTARTMPQILKDGVSVGGFAELRTLLNAAQ